MCVSFQIDKYKMVQNNDASVYESIFSGIVRILLYVNTNSQIVTAKNVPSLPPILILC